MYLKRDKDLISICGLWLETSEKGVKYFSGVLNDNVKIDFVEEEIPF